jgi:hypothetical protein
MSAAISASKKGRTMFRLVVPEYTDATPLTSGPSLLSQAADVFQPTRQT